MLKTTAIASSIGIVVALTFMTLLSSGAVSGASETQLTALRIIFVSLWPGVMLIPGVIGNPDRTWIYLNYAAAILTNIPLYAGAGLLMRSLWFRRTAPTRR